MGSLSALGQSQDKYVCRRLRRQASECWQLQDLCETCKDYLLKGESLVQIFDEQVVLDEFISSYDTVTCRL